MEGCWTGRWSSHRPSSWSTRRMEAWVFGVECSWMLTHFWGLTNIWMRYQECVLMTLDTGKWQRNHHRWLTYELPFTLANAPAEINGSCASRSAIICVHGLCGWHIGAWIDLWGSPGKPWKYVLQANWSMQNVTLWIFGIHDFCWRSQHWPWAVPTPDTIKSLRSFLGLTLCYCRFVPVYANRTTGIG